MNELDPQTEVPLSFWALIDRIQGDATAMRAALAEMEPERLILNFLVYVQLRANLSDVITNDFECSEDTADDVSDGIIANGRNAYIQASTVALPDRMTWTNLENSGLLYLFDSVYYDRFGDSIWDETDALDDEYLPWEPRVG